MNGNILITKKSKEKGDDGHKVFSIRVKEETVDALNTIAKKTNRTRNEIINRFLEYGISHYEVEE